MQTRTPCNGHDFTEESLEWSLSVGIPAGTAGWEDGWADAIRLEESLSLFAGTPLLAVPSSLHLKAVPTLWVGAEKSGLASISPSDLLFGK